MTTTTHADITVTDLGANGALVAFPKDLARVADLRDSFPKARWSPADTAWHVPGKLGYRRACKWAADAASGVDIEARRQLIEIAPRSRYVRLGADHSIVDTLYDKSIVTMCKSLQGSWDADAKVWRIPGARLAQLIEAMPEIDRLADKAAAEKAAEDARREEARARQRAQWAAEREQQAQQRAAERVKLEAHRYIELSSRAPYVGQTLRRRDGTAITVASLGKEWVADDDLSSISNLVGCEGMHVRYVYWREPTSAEVTALEAREAVEREAMERRHAQLQALKAVERSEDRPTVETTPEGEVLWRNDRSAITGYREWCVLTADGWLWHLIYDGSDGAAWGVYNAGHNTRGARMKATPELIAAIKGGPADD